MTNQTFDFSEALRRMREGKKVCRSCWKKNTYPIKTIDKEVIIFNNNSRIIFIDDDAILAEDWMKV